MFKKITVHVPTVMHTEEVEVWIYSFLAPALDSSKCSTTCPSYFASAEINPVFIE